MNHLITITAKRNYTRLGSTEVQQTTRTLIVEDESPISWFARGGWEPELGDDWYYVAILNVYSENS
jgi:hypothetical protein